MGQTFCTCVKADNAEDRSDVYKLHRSTPVRSKDGEMKKKRLFKWMKGRRAGRGKVKRRDQASQTDPMPTNRSYDDEISVQHVMVEFQENQETLTGALDSWSESNDDIVQNPVGTRSADDGFSESDWDEEIQQAPVTSESDWDAEIQRAQDTTESDWDAEIQQAQVKTESDWAAGIEQVKVQTESDLDHVEIQQAPVSLAEENLEDYKKLTVIFDEINCCQYEIGGMLGKGGFGAVYEGTRVSDGLKVAVKYAMKSKYLDYIRIPGYPEPVPREVGLQILASEGDGIPEIIQLLDWQERQDHYVMVLERPSPCKDLHEFLVSQRGLLDEELAKVIMWQVAMAAYMCCHRGVFHRDIKLQNLLITTDTLQVKLIDFGCGDILKESTYTDFMGTQAYFCPEYFEMGQYHGKPATVWSLGVLLYVMVCGKFPTLSDQRSMNRKTWYKDGLSKECCSLIQACLQENTNERIDLGNIHNHKWFQYKNLTDGLQTPVHSESVSQTPLYSVSGGEDEVLHTSVKYARIEEINSCQYQIGEMLGEGGFGAVYEATRVRDGLKVAVKFVKKTEGMKYISIPGHPEPLPQEVGLQMLASEGEKVSVIVQLLDWQDQSDRYIMVLERPSPCEDLDGFVKCKGGSINEQLALVILWQATKAAEACCDRGVFHRDIKMENLLVNPNTLDVKIIDFGCGTLLKESTYKEYTGTRVYACPEYFATGEYHGKPATVYSLGMLMFVMVCGKFPSCTDLHRIEEKIWHKDGLSKECCSLIQACLQANPEERMCLEKIREHRWFDVFC